MQRNLLQGKKHVLQGLKILAGSIPWLLCIGLGLGRLREGKVALPPGVLQRVYQSGGDHWYALA